MFEIRYKVYFDNVWFDSFYGTDYYDDKRVFFSSGARQFFTVYQISRSGDFTLTIVKESTDSRKIIQTAEEFKQWVSQHYPSFAGSLDSLDWAEHPDSRLQ